MRAWLVNSAGGIDALQQVDRPAEPLGERGVRVRIKAASLNYRDLAIVAGGYPRNDRVPVIPVSDAAGEVLETGPGVTQWKPGDRVCPIFVQDWLEGPPTEQALWTCLGGSIDGVLAEERVFPETGLVRIPDSLSWAEAATLPCAAVTAWNALFSSGQIQRGQSVLMLGTGGVSIFALQLALQAGAHTLITSSSDEKLARARQLGAHATINYRAHPEWQEEVRRLTDGRGVDHVIEVGGPGTLERSLKAAAVGGQIHLIGLLDNPSAKVGPLVSVFNCLKIQGIYVGSRAMFQELLTMVEAGPLKPVIDQTFPFADAPAAYRALKSQTHFGKIAIEFS